MLLINIIIAIVIVIFNYITSHNNFHFVAIVLILLMCISECLSTNSTYFIL